MRRAAVVDGGDDRDPHAQLFRRPRVALALLDPRVALVGHRVQPAFVDVDDAAAAHEDLEHPERVLLSADEVLQPVRLRRKLLDLLEAEAKFLPHDQPQLCD